MQNRASSNKVGSVKGCFPDRPNTVITNVCNYHRTEDIARVLNVSELFKVDRHLRHPTQSFGRVMGSRHHHARIEQTYFSVSQVIKRPIDAAPKTNLIRGAHGMGETKAMRVEPDFAISETHKLAHVLYAQSCRLPPHSSVEPSKICV